MSALDDLKTRIDEAIYQNTQQKITGEVLQDTLEDMVDTMGVSVSQNTDTGHIDISVGGNTTEVASAEEVEILESKGATDNAATHGQTNSTDESGTSGVRVIGKPIEGNFLLRKVSFYKKTTSSTFNINLYKKNNDGTFSYVKKIISVDGTLVGSVVMGDLQEFLPAGYYVGIYTGDSAIAFNLTMNESCYTLSSEQGESISATYDEQLSINLLLEGEKIGDGALVETSLLSKKTDSEIKNFLFGNVDDVSLGYLNLSNSSAASGIRCHSVPIPADIIVKECRINTKSTGAIKLLELSRGIDGKMSLVQEFTQYNLGSGLNIEKPNIKLHKGNYIGWWTSANISFDDSSASINSFSFYSVPDSSNPANIVSYDIYKWDVQIIGEPYIGNLINNKIDGVIKGDNIYHFGNYYENNETSWGYNSGGGTSYLVILSTPMEYSGVLKKLYMKATTAGQADFYRAKKNTDGTFDVVGLLGSYPVSVGVNEIEVGVFVNKGEYIGVYLDYQECAIGWNYTDEDNSSCYTPTTNTCHGYGVPYTIRAAALCLAGDIEVTTLEELKRKNGPRKQSAYIFDSEIQTDDFVVESGSWSGFATSTANSFMYLNRPVTMDRQVVRIVIKLDDTNLKIAICGHPFTTPSGSTMKGEYVSFDFVNKVIAIHGAWNGSEAAPDILESASMFSTLVQGRKYILEVEQDTTKTQKARIYDGLTMDVVEVVHTNTSDADTTTLTDYPVGILAISGTANVVRVSQYSKMNVCPTLMIYGDSFTQGWNLIRYGYDSNLCYSHLIESWLGQNNVSIAPQGGETIEDFLPKVSDFETFRPKYVLLALGLNDYIVSSSPLNEFKTNMTKLINKARKYGAEVILQNYAGNSSPLSQYTSWIMNYYLGFRYFDVRAALAVDGTWTPDVSLFLADGHPNVEGNKRMFDNFKVYFADIASDN